MREKMENLPDGTERTHHGFAVQDTYGAAGDGPSPTHGHALRHGHRIGTYSEGSSSASSSHSGNDGGGGGGGDPFRPCPELGDPPNPIDVVRKILEKLRVGDLRDAATSRTANTAARFGNQSIDPLPAGYHGFTMKSLIDKEQEAFRRSVLTNSSPFPQSWRYTNDHRFDPELYPPLLSVHRSSIAEANLQSQQNGLDRNLGLPNRSSAVPGGPPEELYASPATSNHLAPPSPFYDPPPLHLERNRRTTFDYGGISGRSYIDSERWRRLRDNLLHARGSHVNLDRMQSRDDLMNMDIYRMAKDQEGCLFLQDRINARDPHEINVVINAIIRHVVELMKDPFGNYLMQQLLEVCCRQQRMRILLELTNDPAELVRISLDTHGTRAVQSLIVIIKNQPEIVLVVSALKPGFLDLTKDLNGSHVILCCLTLLSAESNKFIFDGAAKHCVDIATHRYGCVVLQSCITKSTGEHRAHMMKTISVNGLQLAQDAFGNYVVQYVLELGNPSASAILASGFEGNYVQLSMQKFSSNVVEKCLKFFFRKEDRARIVLELLDMPRFEQLLQDRYANYVIQSALATTKGPLHAALIRAIRPHEAELRTNLYCKRIFNRANLKKY